MHRSAGPTLHVFLLVVALLGALAPAQAQLTFSAPVSYTVGTNPGNIVTADFNGDGIPDFAVANNGDVSVNDLGSVSVLLGKGDGTFHTAIEIPAGPFPAIILAGDFNGDGKLDLFVEGEPSNNSTVVPWSLMFGRGDGSFGAPGQFALTNFTASIVVGDFNNDKNLDLAFIDTTSGWLELILGDGDGTFQTAQTIATFQSSLLPAPLVAADFVGDGNSDIATVAGGTVQVLLAKADGRFGTPIPLTLNGTSDVQELLAADLNHDGKADLVAISLTRSKPCIFCARAVSYHLEAHLSNGDGSFQPAKDIVTTSTSASFLQKTQGDAIDAFAVGDFDSDGKPDIAYQRSAFTDSGVTTSLVLIGGRGNGTFPSDLGTVSGSFNGNPMTSDLNGDKLADLGAERLTSTTIGVVMNTTQGFSLGAPLSFGSIRAGGSATGTISVDSQNGFSSPVSLTCSAPHFAGIQCSLSSSSVAPGASSTLTVITTGPSATSHSPAEGLHPRWRYALCLPFATLLFQLGLRPGRDTGRKRAWIVLGAVLLFATACQVACSGGTSSSSHNPGTPPGTYAITVSGAAGTVARSTTVNLTVQ